MAQSKTTRKNDKSQSRHKRQKPETGKRPIDKDKNWRLAEDEYAFYKSMLMMPMFGPMDEEDKIKRLEQILEICPEYFLARIELGLNKLNKKLISEAQEEIIRGIEYLFKLGDEEEQDAYVDQLFEALTNTGIFEIIRDVLEIALRHSPDNLAFNDQMGHLAALTGDFDTFEKCMKRCLEGKKNGSYINNYGLGKLIQGDLGTAEEYLRKALAFKVSKQDAENNLEILEWIREEAGRKQQDYFARPIDMRKIDELFEQEDDKAENLAKEHNYEVLHYVLSQLGRKGEYELCVTVRYTLEAFFRFVHQISQDIFIWDDIDFMGTHLRLIMHKFIFKHKDVDKETINEIFDSLRAFFSVIAEKRLRQNDGLGEFITQLDRIRPEMLEKTDKYNAVRHNPKISEKKLEDIREELFEGDHDWMFI